MVDRSAALLLVLCALVSCGGGAKQPEPAVPPAAGAGSASGKQPDERDARLIALAMTRGQAALRDGDLKAAEAQFVGILDLNKDHAGATYYLGVLAEKAGRNQEAQTRYRRALELDPDRGDAASRLGALLLGEDKPAEALPFLRTAVRKNPSDAQGRLQLGIALAAAHDKDGAADQFRLVLKVSEDLALAAKAAVLLAEAGGREDAIRALDALVISARDDESKLAAVAGVYAELKGFRECVAAFDKAIARESHAVLLVHRGLCRIALKDDKGAREDFVLATKTEVGYAPGWYHLGESLREAGDGPGAVSAFRKCIEVGAGGEIATRAQAKIEELNQAKSRPGKKKQGAPARAKPGGSAGKK